MATIGEHHPAFEEYCECIFELREDHIDVIQARVADRLQVSRPSVSEMIKRMETEGLIVIRGAKISLTADGDVLAERVVRRHRIAERFLTDVLGLSWANAHHEAGKWEHIMNQDVESAMNRVLHNPTTCPHGNPSPALRTDKSASRHSAMFLKASCSPSIAFLKNSSLHPAFLKFLNKPTSNLVIAARLSPQTKMDLVSCVSMTTTWH